jgi:hypothetical protein
MRRAGGARSALQNFGEPWWPSPNFPPNQRASGTMMWLGASLARRRATQ